MDQRSSLAFGHHQVSEDQAAFLLAAADFKAEEAMGDSHTVVVVAVVRVSAPDEAMILTEAVHRVLAMAEVEVEAEAEIEITVATIGETTGDHQETTAVPGVIKTSKMACYHKFAFRGVYG